MIMAMDAESKKNPAPTIMVSRILSYFVWMESSEFLACGLDKTLLQSYVYV